NLDIRPRRCLVELTVAPRDGAPVVPGRAASNAQRRGNHLHLAELRADGADHLLERFGRQRRMMRVDAFDVEPESDAEVFFVSEEYVDERYQLAAPFACFL